MITEYMYILAKHLRLATKRNEENEISNSITGKNSLRQSSRACLEYGSPRLIRPSTKNKTT